MLQFELSDIITAVCDRAQEACDACSDETELADCISKILDSAWVACGKDPKKFADISAGIQKSLDFEVKPIEVPKIKPVKTYLEKVIQAAQDLGVSPETILRTMEFERYDDIMNIAHNITDDPDIFDETY